MVSPESLPVIVGVGQVSEHHELTSLAGMLERAAQRALVDADGIAPYVDRVSVPNIMGRPGPSPAGRLAARLKLSPARTETTHLGGTSPYDLLMAAAADVAAGQVRAVLVAGCEAFRSLKAIRSGAKAPAEPDADTVDELAPDPVIGDDRGGAHPSEVAAGLVLPVQMYPVIESALAHRDGRNPTEQRRHCAEMLAPFTEVAAKHPHAWFSTPASVDELAEPSPANRLVAEPYTKRMNAFMGTDQGAAFVVTSLAIAAELGLQYQAVHIWSGAAANDAWYLASRPDITRSPAIEAAGDAALTNAGLTIDDVGLLDVYSCFPSAVQLGTEALGIAPDDSRDLTLTGGLAYFGGPGNNYCSHALATAVDRLRERGGNALLTGLGWFATKHNVVVLGADAPARPFVRADLRRAQESIDATALPIDAEAIGAGRVVGGTVLHGRDGAVEGVPVIVEMADGVRRAARAAADLESFAGVDLVGMAVEVAGDGTFRPA